MNIRLIFPEGVEEKIVEKTEAVTVEALAGEFSSQLKYTAIIAKVNGKYQELTKELVEDSTVELLDMRTNAAYLAYQHSVSLLYLKAAKDVLGDYRVEIQNSLNKGFYTDIRTEEPLSDEQIKNIENRMRELATQDIPIVKEVHSYDEAIEICKMNNYKQKMKLIQNAGKGASIKFYRIDDYRNFFYGLMVPSTGYIKKFELRKYRNGVLLRFPYPSMPDVMPEYVDDTKLYTAFGEAKRWQELLQVDYVPDLNEKLRNGGAKDLILLSEALHEKKIAEIADTITKEKKRIILIAGPSSSGKTTFARRLCIQLRVNGLEPLYMGTDDYFVEREQTPVGEDGKLNFEDLDAIDINLFNDNMNGLLEGREVDLPEFDFIDGKKIFGKRITSISSTQPIVIEGIHALNNKLTEDIDAEEKFKIYISPFTQLNIDVHNRIPTTDARILRRMVRDYKYRGHAASDTLAQWPKVRAGEDKNIFPYNGEADVLFNSALVYELSLLKKYAEPLLLEVEEGTPEYSEAVRMLKFIRFFDVFDDEDIVPNNSIMREFIGGSVFAE